MALSKEQRAERRKAARSLQKPPTLLKTSVAMRLSEPVPKPKGGRFKALSEREWRFVHELVSGEGQVTMKEAAIRAGYAESSAGAMARGLTTPETHPHVVAAIQEFRRELAEKYGTTFERHMRDMQVIRDKALEAGNYGAAVAAEYRRGQALGTIYIDRKEIRHGTIDSMSKEEVMRKLTEIKKLYGGSPGGVLDIEVNQIEEEVDDANQTGSSALEKVKRKFAASDDHEDREPSELGDTGSSDSFGFSFDLSDDGVEGGQDGTQDKP
jgi:phage terminase small subunit